MISRFLGTVKSVNKDDWSITFTCKLFEGFDTLPTAKRMFNVTREVLEDDIVTVLYNDESKDGFLYCQNFVDDFVGLKNDKVSIDITSGESYHFNINDSTKIDIEDGKIMIDVKSSMKISIQDSKAELTVGATTVTADNSSIKVKSPQVVLDGTAGSVAPNPSFTGGLCAMPVCAFSGAPHCGGTIMLT